MVHDTASSRETHEAKQSGVTLSLKSAVTDTVQAVAGDLKRGNDAPSGRLAALYNTRALSALVVAKPSVSNEISAVSAGSNPGSVGIQLTVSSSQSKSESSTQANTARGSAAMAGGNTAIIATGSRDAAGKLIQGTGNLLATGAQISGNTVLLDAANDLLLRSAQNSVEQTSSNSNSGWSAGVGLTFGQQTGVTFSASGYKGSGQANSRSVEQLNTVVHANETLSLKAGRDAVLEGAQGKGATVLAEIGRNLTITSVQDTANYRSTQKQVSAGGSFTYGAGGGSASFSQNKSQAEQNHASVGEQSGIFAGKGGFDIQVGGHTQLNGGAIASAAQEQANQLSTGTFGYSNVQNRTTSSAKASGVSLGTDVIQNPLYAIGKSAVGGLLANANDSHRDESTTYAVVSPGSILVRDGDASSVDGLRRDIQGAHRKLEAADIAGMQQKVDRSSQAGELMGDIGQLVLDEGIRAVLNPKVYQTFCIQQPCTNDQVANNARVEQRAQELGQAHPEWSDKDIQKQALADISASQYNPNRDLDADKVNKVIAGQLDLDADLTATPGARRIANINVIPLDATRLDKLSDEERKNSSIFSNGIFNDSRRGAELALQMTPTQRDRDKIQGAGETYPNTTYLVHTDKTNFLGELVVAGLEKAMEASNGMITSPAARMGADLAKRLSYNQKRDDYSLPLNLIGHSRGTMTETGELNALGAEGYFNKNLAIYVNNPAAKQERLSAAAQKVTGLSPVFWAPPNDIVAHAVGGYPGHWSFADIGAMVNSPNSVHSSGGAGAVGSDPNNVNKDQLFSYEGLDIERMNRTRQQRTIGLLQQWQQQATPRQSGRIEEIQQVRQQSNRWQNQLQTQPSLIPPVAAPAVEADAGNTRLQQLEQLGQGLNNGVTP